MQIRKHVILIIGFFVLVIISGCTHAGQTKPEKLKPSAKSKPAKGEATAFGLELTSNLSKSTYVKGASVRASVSLTNVSKKDVKFEFSSSKRFDLVAEDDAGKEVTRWSAGKAFAQVMTPALLKPGQGEEQQLEIKLDESGTYHVRAETATIFIEESPKQLKTSSVEIVIQD